MGSAISGSCVCCASNPVTAGAKIPHQNLSVNLDDRAVLEFPADPSFYYVLIRGETVADISETKLISLFEDSSGRLVDPDAVSASATTFYRVSRVPRDTPLDLDDDGIDDVYELQRPGFLNPLDAADAGLDPDNNGLSHLEEYLLATAALTTYMSSPMPGEGDVAVARETILRFSNPLAEDVLITEESVIAEFGDDRLTARLHVSPDRDTVTLFYQDFLPASARIRMWVMGDNLVDFAGRLVDADNDGAAGGTGLVEFETLSLSIVNGTSVCGRVFASTLIKAPEGTMSVNEPLQGVRITLAVALKDLIVA